jgi:uncharacterized protein
MSHTPHELAEEFPAHVEKIRATAEKDGHFAKLVDEYHKINRAVHRSETRVEGLTEEHETELRRKRMQLKDLIWAYLK